MIDSKRLEEIEAEVLRRDRDLWINAVVNCEDAKELIRLARLGLELENTIMPISNPKTFLRWHEMAMWAEQHAIPALRDLVGRVYDYAHWSKEQMNENVKLAEEALAALPKDGES